MVTGDEEVWFKLIVTPAKRVVTLLEADSTVYPPVPPREIMAFCPAVTVCSVPSPEEENAVGLTEISFAAPEELDVRERAYALVPTCNA
jgi:hypothetical protein